MLVTPASDTLRFSLVFDTAGQGLFYHGRIGNFNFVYDCGSSSKQKHHPNSLEVATEKFRNGLSNGRLNLLIISHLHTDHVSGMDKLLSAMDGQAALSVDYAILPYLPPVERALLALRSFGNDEWYFQFLLDPVRYLLGKGIKKVVILGAGPSPEDPGERPPQDRAEPPPEDFPEEVGIDDASFKMPQDPDTNSRIQENEDDWNELMRDGKLMIKNHKGYVNISKAWLFRFFNYRVEEKLLVEFGGCLRQELQIDPKDRLTSERLRRIFSNKEDRKTFRHCYDQIAKVLGRDFNNTSLVAFHGPSYNIGNHTSCYSHVCSTISMAKREVVHWPTQTPPLASSLGSIGGGYFLTGDIDMNIPQWEEIERHFEGYLRLISGVLIPHHGSKKNWNLSLLQKVPPRPVCYVSAGIGNSYKHPALKVVESVCDSGCVLFWSSEFSEIMEEGEIAIRAP